MATFLGGESQQLPYLTYNTSTTQRRPRQSDMASIQALSAASQDRKARLAQLKSLKRKQPDEPQQEDEQEQHSAPPPKSPKLSSLQKEAPSSSSDVASKYLSGRNYDPQTKGAKLGFEENPSENASTLERKAAELALQTRQQAEVDAKDDKPLDLFKLQPKKPNWDLKRDLERKLDVLSVRTDNAVARLVRERIQGQQQKQNGGQGAAAAATAASGSGDGEALGIKGVTLVEATNVREREDEEDARREREEDDALLDGS